MKEIHSLYFKYFIAEFICCGRNYFAIWVYSRED
jgi:hypothetical protein